MFASIADRSSSKSPGPKSGARSGAARKGTEAHPANRVRLSSSQVTYILRNLATLLENGVSLPKALMTLSEEKGTERYRQVLIAVRRRLENGETFSHALAAYGYAFDTVLVNQVKVGERSGTLAETLGNVAHQREKTGNLRNDIIKKLAYPVLLMCVGACVIAFLLTYVVPVFQETYRNANVQLPGITIALIMVGSVAKHYGLLMVGVVAIGMVGLVQARRSESIAEAIDRAMLRWPLVGHWARDIAVLQMMETLGNLLEAGFTLADALGEAGNSVANRAVRHSVVALQQAVTRGERFSREIERHQELFPPIVGQLVIIGEQTGKLVRSTQYIRHHLRSEIERKATIAVGVIEPVLTLSLAAAVAVILLAIYLPMFDMINAVGK